MPTTIRLTNGTTLVTVSDMTINTTAAPIALLGRGAVNFSQPVAENFVKLVENFANSTAPGNPLIGQIWYDTTVKMIKVWDGSRWSAVSSSGGSGATTNISGGAGTTTITGNNTTSNRIASWVGAVIAYNGATSTVGLSICEGKIIMVSSSETIPLTALPATLTIDDKVYAFSTRFPNGLRAGLTMATDANAYVFSGTATSSQYADLAERYAASEPLEPGDVVEIGGDAEIQKHRGKEFVFGVVSTKPGVRLNESAGTDATHPFVALSGRVPVKVSGAILKGSRLMASDIPGAAVVAHSGIDKSRVFAIALQSKFDEGLGLVEAALL